MNSTKLEDFLRSRYGTIKKSRGRKGVELIVRCPVCKKRKLSINAITGMYQCWHGCISGHIDQLLGDAHTASFKQATEPKRCAVVAPSVDMPGELIPLLELDYDHQATQYLVGRGFDIKELDATYGLRYCRTGKQYAGGLFNTSNTIVIPVYHNGILVAWQSRLLYNPDKISDPGVCEALGWKQDEDGDWVKPPKYFTMPGFAKGESLYNADWARKSNLVVVTEGVFDCIAVGRCAVATFGKGVTETQMRLCTTYWDLTVLLLDPDAKADAERLNATYRNCIVVNLTHYKDAGEAPRDFLWQTIDQAIATHPQLAQAGKTLDTYNFII